ncbi:GNAT family N-acetyltransferase [Vibrio sp. MEBiC08052]|uniref:GNAT family N-acetyltransferase n=1 Tax=Vibrio sp. MEBiC08052 TaxID=1761910 RepID=UPI0007408809|nr:GNAT family N-acetyltransferase [Vibrio sp. MEBiC08052]KUI99725.1 GCN5-related N-acetyltransferase [Vibrio sp. MEBiC08052]
MSIKIRQAMMSDAKAISELIVPLTRKYVCPTFEVSTHEFLLGSMAQEKIETYLSANYFYVVAVNCNDDVVGVAGIRDYSHLYHLFVDDNYQGQGLSRQLWDVVKQASLNHGNHGYFTVNSAVNAEHVYLRFGFKRIDGVRNRNGMVDIPMALELVDEPV